MPVRREAPKTVSALFVGRATDSVRILVSVVHVDAHILQHVDSVLDVAVVLLGDIGLNALPLHLFLRGGVIALRGLICRQILVLSGLLFVCLGELFLF